jgi:hypothetical protein
VRVFELVLAGVLILVGLGSASRSLRETSGEGTGRERFLVAVQDSARAGFWLSAGGVFLGYALLGDPSGFRWAVMIPIGMAGLRLVAAYLLARSPQ